MKTKPFPTLLAVAWGIVFGVVVHHYAPLFTLDGFIAAVVKQIVFAIPRCLSVGVILLTVATALKVIQWLAQRYDE